MNFILKFSIKGLKNFACKAKCLR